MGIINVTPDSFSEQGLNFLTADAIDAGLRMMDEGADLLDVGGESTRPGAASVPEEEEIRRVMPVIQALVSRGASVSVDTRKPGVARQALLAGVSVVNDVTAFGEPEMAALCAKVQCSVCLMHMQGTPNTMQVNPAYNDVVAEVLSFLMERVAMAELAGIAAERIWLDPGFGFGKTPAHNLQLLHELPRFVETGYPILIGVSRKSSIGAFAGGVPTGERLPGTIAAQVLSQAAGVRIIRAHDVKEARQAIDVANAILKPSLFSNRPV